MILKLINNNKIIEKNIKDLLKETKPNSFLYFHKDTLYKDLKNLTDKLEKNKHTIYLREIKHTLEQNTYIYELHII